MGRLHIALVFDDSLRLDTTEIHVLRAMEELADVLHFRPDRLDEILAMGFDLYLTVDDDTDHRLPDRLRPLAYWAIDTHLDFGARLERARRADLVFAAQRDGAERLATAGIARPVWLPLACDPDVHRRHDVPKEFDFCFVGNIPPGSPRADLGTRQGRASRKGGRKFDRPSKRRYRSDPSPNISSSGDTFRIVFLESPRRNRHDARGRSVAGRFGPEGR